MSESFQGIPSGYGQICLVSLLKACVVLIPRIIQAEANWRCFEGRSFSERVLHPVELCRGSHKDLLSLEDSQLSPCRFK